MNVYMQSIKDFLDSIPKFVKDLEPGNDYLKATGMPKGVWKTLDKFSVKEREDFSGFDVSGRLAVPLSDLIRYMPGWHDYISVHPNKPVGEVYELYLSQNSAAVSEFSLKEFCEKFNDFYLDFLNESGIGEDDLEIFDGSIILKGGAGSEQQEEDPVGHGDSADQEEIVDQEEVPDIDIKDEDGSSDYYESGSE